MNKYEIQVDGITYLIDDISYEFSQQDSENSGRNDDGSLNRDVIGMINKVFCDFEDSNRLKGDNLSNVLKLLKKKSCMFNYFDIMENRRVTKYMYIKSDPIKVYLINDEFVAQPFQIRFVQMDVDNI